MITCPPARPSRRYNCAKHVVGRTDSKFVRVPVPESLSVPPTIWTTLPPRRSMQGRNMCHTKHPRVASEGNKKTVAIQSTKDPRAKRRDAEKQALCAAGMLRTDGG